MRRDDANADDVNNVKNTKKQARNESRFEQIPDGDLQNCTHKHQHNAGRDEDAQGATGCGNSRRETRIIALTDHNRQRDHPKQHD